MADVHERLRLLLRREKIDGVGLSADERRWLQEMYTAERALCLRIEAEVERQRAEMEEAARALATADALCPGLSAEARTAKLSEIMRRGLRDNTPAALAGEEAWLEAMRRADAGLYWRVAAEAQEAHAAAEAEALCPGLSAEARVAKLRALVRRLALSAADLSRADHAWLGAMGKADSKLCCQVQMEVENEMPAAPGPTFE